MEVGKMMKKLIVVFLVLLIGITGVVSARDGGGSGGDEGLKFVWIGTSNVDESIQWFTANAEKKAAELGIELQAFDPNGDVQRQANMVDDAIASGADAVLFIPIDREALIPAAKRAHDAGLVVVTWGGDLAPAGHQYRDFFVGPNDTQAGELAAQAIKAAFPNGASGVMIMGGPGEDPQVKRETGFENGIRGSNITLLDKQACEGWDPARALANMEDFITKYGNKIQYVYCHWDNGATSVVEALEAANMSNVFIVSVDGNREGFRLVNEGLTASTIYQDMALQGTTAVQGAYDILTNGSYKPSGMTSAGEVFVPWTIITKDNANFDPGW